MRCHLSAGREERPYGSRWSTPRRRYGVLPARIPVRQAEQYRTPRASCMSRCSRDGGVGTDGGDRYGCQPKREATHPRGRRPAYWTSVPSFGKVGGALRVRRERGRCGWTRRMAPGDRERRPCVRNSAPVNMTRVLIRQRPRRRRRCTSPGRARPASVSRTPSLNVAFRHPAGRVHVVEERNRPDVRDGERPVQPEPV
jgi:hypothetical protein